MGQSPHKIPDDINVIYKDIQDLKEKNKLCKRYSCTPTALNNFLRRRGHKLERQSVWVLRPITEEEKE
ncbi:MAG: hypothetical protein GY730_12080 [bacterium]|nr:hypothetical protein [bacterium]